MYSQDGSLIIDQGRLAFMSLINDAFIQHVTNYTYTALSIKFAQVFHFYIIIYYHYFNFLLVDAIYTKLRYCWTYGGK